MESGDIEDLYSNDSLTEATNNILKKRKQFSEFCQKLFNTDIEQYIANFTRELNNEEKIVSCVYGGRSWNHCFEGIIDKSNRMKETCVLAGNYDILCLTNDPKRMDTMFKECYDHAYKIHIEVIKFFQFLNESNRNRYKYGKCWIGELEYDKDEGKERGFMNKTISYGKRISFDIYFNHEHQEDEDPYGIKEHGEQYDDTTYHKLIFYLECGYIGNAEYFKQLFIDNNVPDTKPLHLNPLGLYFISNLVIKERKDKPVPLDYLREQLYTDKQKGISDSKGTLIGYENTLLEYICSEMFPLLDTNSNLYKTITESKDGDIVVQCFMYFLFENIYCNIYQCGNNLFQNDWVNKRQHELFLKLFERHKCKLTENESKRLYDSYSSFIKSFQSDCLDVFPYQDLPSIRQIVQTIITGFNIELGDTGLIQISGGDAYRRIDPTLTESADIDCKVFIQKKNLQTSFIHKSKLLLIALLPLLNKYYLRMQLDCTILFAGLEFKMNINSSRQPKLFSLRQINDFVVPLLSLDCRLKTRLIFPYDAKHISDYVKMTPLDIAINKIPENYEEMMEDKEIRTTIQEGFKAGSDMQLAILSDNIDMNIQEQYRESNYLFVNSSERSNIGCIQNDSNLSNDSKLSMSLHYKTVEDTTEHIDVKYVELYLTPCPSNYELKMELEKLLTDTEIVEQRKAVGKHDKDRNRLAIINDIDNQYPYIPSDKNHRNEYLPKKYRDLRNDVEQVYTQDKNIQKAIAQIYNCIQILYHPKHLYTNKLINNLGPMRDDDATFNLFTLQKTIIPKIFNTLGFKDSKDAEAVSEVLSHLHAFSKNQRYSTGYSDTYDKITLIVSDRLQTRSQTEIQIQEPNTKRQRQGGNKRTKKTKQIDYYQKPKKNGGIILDG